MAADCRQLPTPTMIVLLQPHAASRERCSSVCVSAGAGHRAAKRRRALIWKASSVSRRRRRLSTASKVTSTASGGRLDGVERGLDGVERGLDGVERVSTAPSSGLDGAVENSCPGLHFVPSEPMTASCAPHAPSRVWRWHSVLNSGPAKPSRGPWGRGGGSQLKFCPG